MKVGKTIKFLRLSAGLKQSDLAKRLGVSSNYISLVENDRRDPSLSFLKDLSDEFGVPLGLLFLEVEANQSKTSPEERALLMRIKDLIFQIEQMRLHREGQTSHGT
jgi:transcriptional regulator with XRE-family HTH domain